MFDVAVWKEHLVTAQLVLKTFQTYTTLGILMYRSLSLSRPRLFRITAYLERKLWSLPKDEYLTTGNKILWKRGEISPLFHNIFISNFKSPITYTFGKCGCLIYFFLSSSILLYRGTDISKYFRESLGIRDNESRLYMYLYLRWRCWRYVF